MDLRLEVAMIPVTDVDRAEAFYKSLGWRLDADFVGEDGFRVVQLTPPGSACSVSVMKNKEAAGSLQGLHLVVADIDAARAELAERGLEVGDAHHFGAGGQVPGHDPERRDYGTFASFSDPDGNGWVLQEVRSRGGAA
jgi:catechol 2,3-dioxygenase-like lactoylglutathione lyase family enzyme